MESTGILRKVDHLGRIITPIDIRRTLGMTAGEPIEIFLEDDRIIIRKYEIEKACAITGEITEENFEYVDGLCLSPKGAAILLEEIQNALKK